MEAYLLASATFCLLSSFGHTLFKLGSGRVQPGIFNLVMMILAFGLLSTDLWMRGEVQRSCPINSLFDVLVFMSWSTILIYFVVGSAYRLSLLGAFTSPLVLGILLFAQITPINKDAHMRLFRDHWIELHAAVSIISYGAFALAGVAGLMYLLQNRQLKKRKGGTLLYNLPPITDLGIANARLIWLGLILLSVSFAAGFASGMQVNTLKFWTSAGIWAAYALMVLLRGIHTMAPKRTAILSVGVFIFILVTLPVIQHLSNPK